jgi:L-fucose isomerase-like protein
MSMMSERFLPSACEVDVTGVLTMYAMQLAAAAPAALVDWNNSYGAAHYRLNQGFVILEVADRGAPSLLAYRRAVITVQP